MSVEAILRGLESSAPSGTPQASPSTQFLSATDAGSENPLGTLDPGPRLAGFSLRTEIDTVVRECALDGELFGRTFFPKTFRQQSPPFHADIWELLNSEARLVNIQVFRGGAKTSLLRTYVAHRIAYGLSHTVLVVGKSEAHAVRSLSWLRKQIQYNIRFATVFALKAGEKWAGNEITIVHGIDEYPITLIAMGLSGSIRGINVDDYRPDLIIVDDILDEENAATEEQREKIAQLVFGSLVQSLTPRSEDETAKLVMLQTPQDSSDLSMAALNNPLWRSARFPIWTRETEDLDVSEQESAWPVRWSSAELRKAKLAAIETNTYSIWARENELKPIKSERLAFRADWREYYDDVPVDGFNIIAIDPVPPPSEHQIAKGLQHKDYEAFVVLRISKGGYYILDGRQHRGHEPEWTIATFLELAIKYNPRNVYVESVQYQRVLAWILRRAQERQGRYWAIIEVTDLRKKYTRIIDALHGPYSNRRLFFPRGRCLDLLAQLDRYPDVSHDDFLDALAMGITQTTRHFWHDSDDDAEDAPLYPTAGRGFKQLQIAGDAP